MTTCLVFTSIGALEMRLLNVVPKLHVCISFYIRYYAVFFQRILNHIVSRSKKNIMNQGIGKKNLNALRIMIQITRPDSFSVYQSANLSTGQIAHRRVH